MAYLFVLRTLLIEIVYLVFCLAYFFLFFFWLTWLFGWRIWFLFAVLVFLFGVVNVLVGILGVLLNVLAFHLTYMFLFGIHGAFLAYLEFGKRTWGFVWHTWYIG